MLAYQQRVVNERIELDNRGQEQISKPPMAKALEELSTAHDCVSEEIERAISKFNMALLPGSTTAPHDKKEPEAPSNGLLVDIVSNLAIRTNKQADLLRNFNDRCAI